MTDLPLLFFSCLNCVAEKLIQQLKAAQAASSSLEDSLSRLQQLKSADEAQLSAMSDEARLSEKDRLSLINQKEELEEEVLALKRELVRAEELRMRLESFSTSLEQTIHVTNADNEEMKEQLEQLIQV